MKILKILLLTVLLIGVAFSRQNHPPDLNWQTIETKHFQVIFPAEVENIAQDVANLAESVYFPICNELKYFPPKTPIILHTQTDIANAFVTLFPFRMELFLTDLQFPLMGPGVDWLRILVTHEFRHIVQLQKRSGFIALARITTGEQGALLPAIGYPGWWLEGDATFTETAYTSGGRGRSASFDMALAAQLNEKGTFRYQKAYLGSQKDLVPSIYHLGYYLTQQIDSDTTKLGLRPKIMDWYGWVPLGPIGFNIAVHLSTRKSLDAHYKAAMAKLAANFKAREEREGFTEYELLNLRKNEVPINYRSPRWTSDGSVIAYRSGFDARQQLVVFETGGEEQTILPRRIGENLSVQNGILGWTETVDDIRWAWKIHSKVRLFDLEHKRYLDYDISQRLLWMDLAPDGLKIAGVVNEGLYSNIIIKDLEKGQDIALTRDKATYYSYPRYSADGQQLAVVVRHDSTQSLQIIDLKNGARDTLFVTHRRQLSHPVFGRDGKHLFFSADLDGRFNVWALELNTGGLFRVTNARYGAFAPDVSPNGRELVFSNYSALGFDVALMRLAPENWLAVDKSVFREKLPTRIYHVPHKQPPLPTTRYAVKSYRVPARYMLPHSWGIISEQSGSTEEGRFGAIVQAMDPLYRFNWTGVATYDLFRETIDTRVRMRYSRFWPVFGLDAFYDQEALISSREDTVAYWKELGGAASITLPMTLRNNHYQTTLSLTGGVELAQIREVEAIPSLFPQLAQRKTAAFGSLRFNNLVPPPIRGLGIIQQGQALQIEFESVDPSEKFNGQQLLLNSGFFLPGLRHHDAFQVFFGYVRQTGNFFWETERTLPRGFSGGGTGGSTVLRLNYAGPVAYLDWHIPYVSLYIKSLSANLFYDAGSRWRRGEDNFNFDDLRSTGGELKFHLNPFQLPATLVVGVRYIYFPDTETRKTEIFFGL